MVYPFTAFTSHYLCPSRYLRSVFGVLGIYTTLAATKFEVFEAHKQVSGLISYVCQILFSTTQIWPMLMMMKCSRNKKQITSFIFNRYLVDKNHSKRSFVNDSGGLKKKFLFLNSKANPKSDLKIKNILTGKKP